ncbi:MAG: O-antigen ligase family protein [Solirubrobacterales bacterium]
MAKNNGKSQAGVRSNGKQQINKRAVDQPSNTDRVTLFLLMAGLAIIPLLMRLRIINYISPKIIVDIFNTGTQTDISSYYKFAVTILITFCGLGLLVYKMVKQQYQLRATAANPFILLLVATAVISVLFSDFPGLSVFGIYDRHEGLVAFLCYFSLLFIAINTRFPEKITSYLLAALAIPVGLNAILAIGYFAGHDLISTGILAHLILPAEYRNFGLAGYLMTTISNPNFVSGLAGAITIFFMVIALNAREKQLTIATSVLGLLSFALIETSLSSSGTYSFFAVLPFVLGFSIWNQSLRQVVIRSAVFLAGMALVIMVLSGIHGTGWKVSFGSPTSDFRSQEFAQGPENKLKLTPAEAVYGDEVKLPEKGIAPLSGRTYIWKHSLELIAKRPLLGYGHDSIVYTFPQNRADKIANLSNYVEYIDKPHNFYIALAYQSGIGALLAFIGLMAVFAFTAIRTIAQKRRTGEDAALLIAILLFAGAYCVQWMVNDSIQGSAQIFWIMLGIGFSLCLFPDSGAGQLAVEENCGENGLKKTAKK